MTLLSILPVLNGVVVWMVSTHPPTSKSSSPFNNPLVTVPKAPTTIGIMVTFMFHFFFQFPTKVEVLILLFTFFQSYSVVSRDSKVDTFASSLCFGWLLLGGACGLMVIVVRNGHVVQILDETDCISHSINTLWKGMNPIILPPAMGK